MDLKPSAAAAYPSWWSFITYAASHLDANGDYSYTSADVNEAVGEIARNTGTTVSFQEFTGITSLFSIARGMERAADELTAAPDASPITARMISEAPYSRSLADQQAAPQWKLVAEITYRAPDGTTITSWGTGFFQNTLHTSVGALRDEAWLQFSRMLNKRDEQKNTGGELLNIGRSYLIAV